LYEQRLLEGVDIGGRAYAVCDPGKPVRYGDLYEALSYLSVRPTNFMKLPPIAVVTISTVCEWFARLQHNYLTFLPGIGHGDLSKFQRAMLNYCTVNVIYDDSKARKELGYDPGYTTLEGVCEHLIEWNDTNERKAKENGKTPELASTAEKVVPVPNGIAK
jgi:nucleoside-diphosphate-sugar epimerase